MESEISEPKMRSEISEPKLTQNIYYYKSMHILTTLYGEIEDPV